MLPELLPGGSLLLVRAREGGAEDLLDRPDRTWNHVHTTETPRPHFRFRGGAAHSSAAGSSRDQTSTRHRRSASSSRLKNSLRKSLSCWRHALRIRALPSRVRNASTLRPSTSDRRRSISPRFSS